MSSFYSGDGAAGSFTVRTLILTLSETKATGRF